MNRAPAAGAPREKLVERALALVVQADLASPSQSGTALLQWAGRSAEHQAAAEEAQRRWAALGGMAGPLREHFGEPAAQPTGASRRHLLLSAAALLGTGLLAARAAQWAWQAWHAPLYAAQHRTGTAELLALQLPDGAGASPGSRLALGACSRIDVALYRQRRVVEMAEGELRCDVQHDESRPFELLTRAERLRVLGTVFSVRDRGGVVTVGVERGLVRVEPRSPPDGSSGSPAHAGLELRAGEWVELRAGVAGPVRRGDTAALSAWREGWLVFQNTPLGEALTSVNAYRPQPIVADARVAALRLSGRFPARDSAALLAALPAILPLSVHAVAGGRVELRAR